MRGQNIHNIYKQKLVERLIEKRERADKIKEQQVRISELCRIVKHATPSLTVATSPVRGAA